MRYQNNEQRNMVTLWEHEVCHKHQYKHELESRRNQVHNKRQQRTKFLFCPKEDFMLCFCFDLVLL